MNFNKTVVKLCKENRNQGNRNDQTSPHWRKTIWSTKNAQLVNSRVEENVQGQITGERSGMDTTLCVRSTKIEDNRNLLGVVLK